MSKSGLFAHFKSKDEVELSLLDRLAEVADTHVVNPAMQKPEGLPRLIAVAHNWFGWSTRAGLSGGCPAAAAMFELDDMEGPVRDKLLAMEKRWNSLLKQLTRDAITQGHLRKDLDVEQFLWELNCIYLNHHVSMRFFRDRQTNARVEKAFEGLLERSIPLVPRGRTQPGSKSKGK